MKNCISKYVLLALLSIVQLALHAQTTWYFGANAVNCAGMSFNPNPSSLSVPKAAVFYECGTVVSDALGNVQFYSNGVDVFNKNHQKMSNSGLLGAQENNNLTDNAGSSPNGVLSVPDPGNPNRYYIFTINDLINGTRNGLRYSIVDMTLNGGLGDIDPGNKNVVLLDGNAIPTAEMMAAISAPCGDTIWIVAHGAGNNTFYSIPLTKNGVSLADTVQTQDGYNMSFGGNDMRGSLAFSPNGQHLAFCGMVNAGVWLYNFTASGPNAGKLTPWNIGKNGTNQILTTGVYSVEWSPNSQNLYTTSLHAGVPMRYFNSTLAYNAGVNPADIANGGETCGTLRLGPDGVMYIGKQNTTNFLGTITNPDAATSAAVVYTPNGFNAGNAVSPSLPNAYLPSMPYQSIITKPLNDTIVCSRENPFQLQANIVGGTWSADSSAFISSSGMFDPSKGLGGVGPWPVKVYYTFSNCILADSVVITVEVCPCPDTTLAPSIPSICKVDNIDLNPYKVTTEPGSWSIVAGPLGHTATMNGSTFQGNNSASGSYTVRYTLSTNTNGCPNYAERNLVIKANPNVTFVLSKDTVCEGEAAFALSGGSPLGGNYTGSSVSSGSFDPLGKNPGEYIVTYSATAAGCTASANDTLELFAKPVVALKDTMFCDLVAVTLIPNPSNYASYAWSDNSSGSTLSVSSSGKYWVIATNASGCASDTAKATVTNFPDLIVNFGADKIACDGETVTLDASAFGPFKTPTTYLWNGVAGNSTKSYTTGGKYDVLVTDGNGCKGKDTVEITFNNNPTVTLGNDTIFCVSQYTLTKSVANTYNSVLWSNSQTANSIVVTSPGEIWVQVSNLAGCTASDTVNIIDKCDSIVICFPNVITPNGDGFNEQFKACIDDYQNIDDPTYAWYLKYIEWGAFSVYDRWGIKMFESDKAAPLWDGNYKGNKVASGTYFWIANYNDTYLKKEYQVTGWMQVIE
jgi:gliding motility-associated-like protein